MKFFAGRKLDCIHFGKAQIIARKKQWFIQNNSVLCIAVLNYFQLYFLLDIDDIVISRVNDYAQALMCADFSWVRRLNKIDGRSKQWCSDINFAVKINITFLIIYYQQVIAGLPKIECSWKKVQLVMYMRIVCILWSLKLIDL